MRAKGIGDWRRMIDEIKLNHFFSVLREKKKSFAENYKYFAPKLAPKFNIFNFVRRDENALSFIISNLLDPQGDHEQGTVFLRLFLDMLDLKLNREKSYLWSKVEKNIDKARCVTESATGQIENRQRRIDIVVDFGNFGIGIENKPWACDQKDQLLDYSLELEKRYPTLYGADFILIYLTGGDWDVSQFTISSEKLDVLISKNRFVQITFFEIRQWLLNCEMKCVADRVRFFLRDFIEYCDVTFLGVSLNMGNENLISNYMLSSASNLELSFDIGSQIDDVKSILSNKFADKIAKKLKIDCLDLVFRKADNFGYSSKKNSNLYIFKEDWELCIGIGYDNYDGFYWGVTKWEAHNKYLKDIEIAKIETRLGVKVKRYANLKWWYSFLVQFEKPYSYWVSDNSQWRERLSNDDILVDIVATKIVELYNAIVAEKIEM